MNLDYLIKRMVRLQEESEPSASDKLYKDDDVFKSELSAIYPLAVRKALPQEHHDHIVGEINKRKLKGTAVELYSAATGTKFEHAPVSDLVAGIHKEKSQAIMDSDAADAAKKAADAEKAATVTAGNQRRLKKIKGEEPADSGSTSSDGEASAGVPDLPKDTKLTPEQISDHVRKHGVNVLGLPIKAHPQLTEPGKPWHPNRFLDNPAAWLSGWFVRYGKITQGFLEKESPEFRKELVQNLHASLLAPDIHLGGHTIETALQDESITAHQGRSMYNRKFEQARTKTLKHFDYADTKVLFGDLPKEKQERLTKKHIEAGGDPAELTKKTYKILRKKTTADKVTSTDAKSGEERTLYHSEAPTAKGVTSGDREGTEELQNARNEFMAFKTSDAKQVVPGGAAIPVRRIGRLHDIGTALQLGGRAEGVLARPHFLPHPETGVMSKVTWTRVPNPKDPTKFGWKKNF